MRGWWVWSLATLLGLAVWTLLVLLGTWYGWWRQPLAPPGDAPAFMQAVRQDVDAGNRGNAVVRLLQAGQTVGEHSASVGDPVGAETVFQTASVSKWVTAWGVMALVERGGIELDAPVTRYLTRWRLPDTGFDNDGVTVRRLLSHTAGLTDSLGYDGFPPGSDIQTLEQSLTRAADACCGLDGRVQVGTEPGAEWQYSGGGFTLLQLLIEEATGETFAAYMQRVVLQPLGMYRSTFQADEVAPADLATFYDEDGTPAPHYRYTATAAASLYSTAADMSRFAAAHAFGAHGAPPGRGVLLPETVDFMRQPHAALLGIDIWGLGVMLYVADEDGASVIGHDGANAPAINTSVRVHSASGDGIVVLVTGDQALAGRLAGEWVFWRTGSLDIMTLATTAAAAFMLVLVGWAVIIVVAIALAIMGRRREVSGSSLD